mmetsp:Transcript_24307/g.54089  ORF Transcript_24307/g.54089 Transcript_24307/m.54089 type:complete len:210 (-) Transcript_24307:672-1301(-)
MVLVLLDVVADLVRRELPMPDHPPFARKPVMFQAIVSFLASADVLVKDADEVLNQDDLLIITFTHLHIILVNFAKHLLNQGTRGAAEDSAEQQLALCPTKVKLVIEGFPQLSLTEVLSLLQFSDEFCCLQQTCKPCIYLSVDAELNPDLHTEILGIDGTGVSLEKLQDVGPSTHVNGSVQLTGFVLHAPQNHALPFLPLLRLHRAHSGL